LTGTALPFVGDLTRHLTRTANDDSAVPEAEARRPRLPTPKSYEGGTVALLTDANYLARLIEELKSARKSIHVSMFYFSAPTNAQHPSRAIINALTAAHRRGVSVRVLL
jgi:phosphatidylserine/phosphatidylglycerophosphate/cardiolipin synthase-like enzyme